MIVKGEPVVYHIISRSVLDGYPLEDQDKDYLLDVIRWLSQVYFTEVLGFCIMGNHFHLLVRMHIAKTFSDREIQKRYKIFDAGQTNEALNKERVLLFRKKWSNLSEYVREIKQRFSRYYNKTHKRKGFFWAERFKSVIVDNGEALVHCLTYIDLNPIRAGLTKKPEDYRWCSLGYHIQTKNKENFLSLDFGLKEFDSKPQRERVRSYLKYVHQKAGLIKGKGAQGIDPLSTERFRHRTRYFSDSGIIGKKEFVTRVYGDFKDYFQSREKKLRTVRGLDGVYSLKRLSEK
jgi:REP element-mobilizing transposase RayT